MSAPPFRHRLRVRYVECDMQGRVFNAHYLTWFDIAHTELLREAAGFPGSFERTGIDVVVGEAAVTFRAPAAFDEELEIGVALDEPTRRSLTSRFTVARNGTTLAEGSLRHVCVDAATYRPVEWPAWLRERLAPYVVAPGAEARPRPSSSSP
jgi:acyl-CoA thioester hydrolase